jgi:hypothetical protein
VESQLVTNDIFTKALCYTHQKPTQLTLTQDKRVFILMIYLIHYHLYFINKYLSTQLKKLTFKGF